MIHFLSLNIWYVIYVVFWIKYLNLKLPHHCILFLFTICTVSQLFWNRVCIYIYIYIYVCVCIHVGSMCVQCTALKNLSLHVEGHLNRSFVWQNNFCTLTWTCQKASLNGSVSYLSAVSVISRGSYNPLHPKWLQRESHFISFHKNRRWQSENVGRRDTLVKMRTDYLFWELKIIPWQTADQESPVFRWC